jgi:UDP-N-acetylglucosamine 2-epimerase (non-hydrolysing)
MKPTILLVAGARPNFMKIAPIVARVRATGSLDATIVHTGQHYDRAMSELLFEQLGIPEPEIRLGVGSGSHAQQTAEIMRRFEPVLVERRPDAIAVVGDVNSTIATALVAVKLGVPVAHVEAGLRSFDRSMPEEVNRILTDAISEWLFVTERSGVENLENEGIDSGKVHIVGNVMIDTLLRFRDRALELDMPNRMGLEPGAYAVMTLHRPSNVDEVRKLAALLEPIRRLGERLPVIFPVHPRTRKSLEEMGIGHDPGLRLLEPLGYLEFLGLMASARLILTDSGGIQEESTVLGVPCITLRDNTERPVTLTDGTNRLAGTDPDAVDAAIEETLTTEVAGRIPPLWDGRAAERIVSILAGALTR